MRVLASVLVGASAVSAAKVADNAGAAAKLSAAADTTATIGKCLDVYLEAVKVNNPTMTAGVFDPKKSSAATNPPDTMTENALGIYGGGVHAFYAAYDSDATSLPTANNLAAAALKDGAITGGSADTDMDLANLAQLWGGDGGDDADPTDFGTVGMKHKKQDGTKLKGAALQQDGADSAVKGTAVFFDTSRRSLAEIERRLAAGYEAGETPFVLKSSKTYALTGAKVAKVLMTQLSSCYVAFKQEATLTATVAAAASGTPETWTYVSGTTTPTLATKQQVVNRGLGFTHVGTIGRALIQLYYNVAAGTASGNAQAMWTKTTVGAVHPVVANILANKNAQGESDATIDDVVDHPCVQHALGVYKHNGGKLKTATGTSAGNILGTEKYQCMSGTISKTDPCNTETGKDNFVNNNWGEWDTALYAADGTNQNKWLVPLIKENAGSSLFSLDYAHVVVPSGTYAVESGHAAGFCSAYTKAADAGDSASGGASQHRCTLDVSAMPNALKQLSPLFVDNAILEVIGSTANFNAVTGATIDDATGDNTKLKAISDELKKDLDAGVTLRVVTQNPADWTTIIASNLDVTSAACTAIRTHVEFLRDERCDIGEGAFNTRFSGSIFNDVAIATGKTTKHASADHVIAPGRTGWFSQVYAACGHATKDAPSDGATPNCTHVESHAGSGNARKTAFEDFKKNTSNKCNKGTNGAWSRFGAVAITAVLAAFAF